MANRVSALREIDGRWQVELENSLTSDLSFLKEVTTWCSDENHGNWNIVNEKIIAFWDENDAVFFFLNFA